jgi:uncharacterized protein YigE (DUF2233 family)
LTKTRSGKIMRRVLRKIAEDDFSNLGDTSTLPKPRNGVDISSPQEVHFVITERWLDFYDFARFFCDRLGCSDALFLDGGIAPGLYAPELGRNDAPGHRGFGPIIAVVE